MKPLDYPLLADENIHLQVIFYLRGQGHEVGMLSEKGAWGLSDEDVLKLATGENRVVLTHDSDFGRLAVAEDKPFVGIIYLRPGHIRADFTIQTIEAIKAEKINVNARFLLVAERTGTKVKIRIRQR
jgi:predicted nuclease of predicted toxin-antitoxin system